MNAVPVAWVNEDEVRNKIKLGRTVTLKEQPSEWHHTPVYLAPAHLAEKPGFFEWWKDFKTTRPAWQHAEPATIAWEAWAGRAAAPITPVARRAYISGPMTGIAELNAPAFAAEAARLLALGYQVENPADVVLPDGATWADFMRADIPRLLACTHIRMLDGWTMSKGARLEHHIAISLGLEVLTDCDLQEAPCTP